MNWEFAFAGGSAAGAILAALFSCVIYRLQTRKSQSAEIMRLHELWWSDRYREPRAVVYALVKEFDANDQRHTPILRSYKCGDNEFIEEKRNVALIAFFFADLNAMIDEGLIRVSLAYRLFGAAQFSWFSDFLLAVGNEVELRITNEQITNDQKPEVRWISEVRDLETRFKRLVKNFEL